MKKILFILFTASIIISCSTNRYYVVNMQTTAGDIELALYNETPQHRDNFVKLVKEHVYDSLLFHRVIRDFMIQGGDPTSKNAVRGAMLGEGDLGYTVEAEFMPDVHFHKRGVLAAAREGDDVNPKKASSACQFYIVWGKIYTPESLQRYKEFYKKRTGKELVITPEQEKAYTTIGGTPHLDGNYTVFGEVTKGLEVVDAIQQCKCDRNDRPLEDIRILKTKVRKEKAAIK